MSEELEILKEFPLKIQIQIPWVDMDIYKHVNNANYFRYFEEGRVRYLEQVKFYQQYETNGLAGVLSKASCNYIIPLTYPDIITVGTRIVEIQKDNLHMEQYISSPKSGLAAFGKSEICIFDFNRSKTIKVPDDLIESIEKFENKSFS
ncbi:MAG: acyl-CoA thioesterase [Bacteroidetes bacterium]|nr:acyl-CoA thioesterase [Bacteroidota bacterium]